MSERQKSGSNQGDLIDALIAMNKEDPDLFHGDTLVAQAGIFLIVGFETSASVTSFALYVLAKNPKVQGKIRAEIRDYISKYGAVQYETINEMEYLNMVVKANEEDSYSLESYQEFKLPKGMPVYIPVVATHRDPKYIPNREEFIPERFNRDFVDQSVYLAFGLGPRNCVGIRFAYFQVKLAMITILQNYKIKMFERTPKIIRRHKKSLVTRSEDPLYVNLMRE
ncbi:hypothetical protein DMENIID0001_038920 [Sergentomyia squamirostris]